MNLHTKKAGRITGLTPRRLDYWDRGSSIKPSAQEASGQGSVRLYSFVGRIIEFSASMNEKFVSEKYGTGEDGAGRQRPKTQVR